MSSTPTIIPASPSETTAPEKTTPVSATQAKPAAAVIAKTVKPRASRKRKEAASPVLETTAKPLVQVRKPRATAKPVVKARAEVLAQVLPAKAKPKATTAAVKAPVVKAPVTKAPVVKTVVAKPASDKLLKDKKPKLVRDSFTIPKAEFLMIDQLKQRSGVLGNSVKKSELIRAGIKALAAMPDAKFLAAIRDVPTIKTGRPAHA